MSLRVKSTYRSLSVENATAFCVNTNGLMESQLFLTLVSCQRDNVISNKQRRWRSRTFSLPSTLDDYPKFANLKRSSRCFSDGVLKVPRRYNFSDVCRDCVPELKLHKKENAKTLVKGKRKTKQKNIVERKIKCNNSGSSPSASSTLRKKIACRQHRQGAYLPCSATSFKMDGYMLSYFVSEMRRSQAFRSSFINFWSNAGKTCIQREGPPILVIVMLMEPENEVLDLLGNKMVNSNILYRRSLEHALSWLSTLGGAFSALGDLSSSWAEEAGHVSLTQLRIAMKLGDPGILSRCRLYAAISLLQRGYLISCREIVKSEYQYAIFVESIDPRLRRMCLGIWSKLQYHWKQIAKTDKKMLKLKLDGLEDIRNNTKYWNVYDLEEGRKIACAKDNECTL